MKYRQTKLHWTGRLSVLCSKMTSTFDKALIQFDRSRMTYIVTKKEELSILYRLTVKITAVHSFRTLTFFFKSFIYPGNNTFGGADFQYNPADTVFRTCKAPLHSYIYKISYVTVL